MINPIAFKIGPFSIRWYAICIVTGLILAVYLAMKEAPRKKIIPDDILDFILVVQCRRGQRHVSLFAVVPPRGKG